MKKYRIEITEYSVNSNLALLLYEKNELVCDITVNLGVFLLDEFAYLNINNLPSYIIDMLKENKIFKYTGNYRQSGFVNYPLCEFNIKKIHEFNKKMA